MNTQNFFTRKLSEVTEENGFPVNDKIITNSVCPICKTSGNIQDWTESGIEGQKAADRYYEADRTERLSICTHCEIELYEHFQKTGSELQYCNLRTGEKE